MRIERDRPWWPPIGAVVPRPGRRNAFILGSYQFDINRLLGRTRRVFSRRHPGQVSVSERDPVPIRCSANCLAAMVDGFPSTISAGGYGSGPSLGRRGYFVVARGGAFASTTAIAEISGFMKKASLAG
jgi:hypothetical protein